MANGTIAFDTLQTSGQITGTAKSVDTDYLASGSAKVWVRSTDAAVITQSLNVSGGTDSGTGHYVYAFTNSFNYSSDHAGIGVIAGPDNGYFRKQENDGSSGSLAVRGVSAPGTGGSPAGIDTECSLNITGDLA